MPTFSLTKPPISSDKVLTKTEQDLVSVALKESGSLLIHKELTPYKNDYTDDINRGSVVYTEKCNNYSFHKVTIPDGTTITGKNFAQKLPHTVSISGKNLHFVDCNLNNVELDPTWMFDHTLRIHSKHETVLDGGKNYDVYFVEKNGKFEEVKRTEVL